MHAGSAGCKFGWSLAPGQCCPADISRIAIITCDAKAAAKLSSQLQSSGCPYKLPVQASPLAMVGDPIMAIGSPFGVSAPELFSDMVISGIVSRLSMRVCLSLSALLLSCDNDLYQLYRIRTDWAPCSCRVQSTDSNGYQLCLNSQKDWIYHVQIVTRAKEQGQQTWSVTACPPLAVGYENTQCSTFVRTSIGRPGCTARNGGLPGHFNIRAPGHVDISCQCGRP
jgi:hypothetical protein